MNACFCIYVTKQRTFFSMRGGEVEVIMDFGSSRQGHPLPCSRNMDIGSHGTARVMQIITGLVLSLDF